MRAIVRLAMTLVALAAAALSYQSLARLGELCGYGGLSWLYPLVVDAGAAASCATWLHTRGRQPLVMTWALLSVSVLLNGTTHFLTSTGTAPGWLLVVGVAAVPPTVLGLCVHLAVGMGAPAHRETPAVSPALPPAQPAAESPVPPARPKRENTRPTKREILPPAPDPQRVRELSDSGMGRRAIARETGLSEHVVRQLLEARNGATLTH